MTSKNEGLPVVLIEAAQFGVPALSTKVGGVSDFISDNETGFLVERSPNAIAKRILALLNDSELVNHVKVKVKSMAEERYSVSHYVLSIENIYIELVSG
jgi:glycosyltransferase involved in cell wall biosynthesis